METIKVIIKSKERKYNIAIGKNILGKLNDFISYDHNGKRIAVITDDMVNKLYMDKLTRVLRTLNPFFISIPGGESSKSRDMKEKIEDMLLNNKFGRDSLIIAIGGGVVGDLSGFVASTFNRGIPIIHVPTTLLAMADSSIGGKTSINTRHGKNLIGTVHQPAAVFADMDFLETLSDEEFRNGVAEIIKMSIIRDKALFDFVEKNHEKILARDKKILQQIIKRSIELKKDVVEQDAEETGLRQILNFGHTFGHALEAYHNYKIKHGYAISQGIIVESKISVITKNLKENEEERIRKIIKLFGFPIFIDMGIEADKIFELMASDKKTRNQKPKFVLIEKIGKVKSEDNYFSFEFDNRIIKKAIDFCKK